MNYLNFGYSVTITVTENKMMTMRLVLMLMTPHSFQFFSPNKQLSYSLVAAWLYSNCTRRSPHLYKIRECIVKVVKWSKCSLSFQSVHHFICITLPSLELLDKVPFGFACDLVHKVLLPPWLCVDIYSSLEAKLTANWSSQTRLSWFAD